MKHSLTIQAAAAGIVGLALLGCSPTPPAETTAPAMTDGITRDFSVVSITGEEITGESLRGHVTIIDFFAVF